MSVFRSPYNPIIEPKDVKPSRDNFEVIGVFNAGVARFQDEVILLLRVAERPVNKRPDVVVTAVYDSAKADMILKQFARDDPENNFSDSRLIITPAATYLTSISHLRLARSTDGVSFNIEQRPAMMAANDYETFGLEDPRISLIDGIYYISYVAVSPRGVTTSLASTKDFDSFQRHGVIFCPDNKDVVIFPATVDDKYYALHRPVSPLFKNYEIWMSESADLRCWGNNRCLIGPNQKGWDETKLGAGAVPFRTKHGWLEIYHGADQNNRYCLGAILLDADRPWVVLARTEKPILEPQSCYEQNGFFGDVVFTCGLLCEDGMLKIYYGAADTTVCYAQIPLQDVLGSLNF